MATLWDRISMQRKFRFGKLVWELSSARTGKVILGLTRCELLELLVGIQVEIEQTKNADSLNHAPTRRPTAGKGE